MSRRPLLGVLCVVAFFAIVDVVDAGLPTPTVHRTSKGDRAALDLGRRAPASLYHLFGETPDQQDPETEGGGDGGGETGGEGTGEADMGNPNLDVAPNDLSGDGVFSRLSNFNAIDLIDPLFAPALGRRSNIALSFNVPAGEPGFATPPGYGNNWDQWVVWQQPPPSPSSPVQVRVRFVVNHDLEPGNDVFRLEVRREPTGFETVHELTGVNSGVTGPGPAIVDETFTLLPSEFTGTSGAFVDLRLRVLTDRSGSDEDGLWPSDGAAQVDEIRVWFDGTLISSADFEGAVPNDGGWTSVPSDRAGSFLKLLELTQDLDPCRSNVTYQYTFIDDGTPPVGDSTGSGTGGTRSGAWSYGPGGYVVNHTGGISDEGRTPIHDALRTPAFSWDLPGTTEDDGATGGLLLFSVWKHLPLENGIFYFWRVRSHSAATGWSPWRDFDEVYYEPSAPHYERVEIDVSTLMVSDPDSAQFELGVIDLADALGLPGGDATPSPMFDNIGFAKFFLDGPSIRIADEDRFQSAFPTSGTADYDIELPLHAIRVDAAKDIVPGATIVPGDSMVVRVRPSVPGSPLAGAPKLVWALRANPRYTTVRTLPAGSSTEMTVTTDCGDAATVYTGEVVGQPVVTATGQAIADLWSFDLPDGPAHATWHGAESGFLYPGDVLRWFVEASDVLGNTTTAPEDTTDFFRLGVTSALVDEGNLVRGLPSLDGTASHPSLLVVDDTGSIERSAVIDAALDEIGLAAGCDVDLYRVRASGAGLSNGIGSAAGHGANAAQLADYDTIVFFSGDQGAYLLSDGSGDPLDDDGDDLGVLLDWKQQTGARRVILFGDNLVSGLEDASTSGSLFAAQELGVALQADDVRPSIGGQTAPEVAPISTSFTAHFVAGACLSTDEFDAIMPAAGTSAVRSHQFLDPDGNGGAYAASAIVWHQRTATEGSRTDVTVPISFSSILDVAPGRVAVTARARVLEELLGALDGVISTNAPGSTLRVARLAAPYPNPFNPRTNLSFDLPRDEVVQLRVLDLAGRHVTTLVDDVKVAGSHRVVWNGQDDRGAAVASGIYLVDFRAGDVTARRKVALIR